MMELPVVEWQDCAHRKWTQLPRCEKAKFSATSGLMESFMACWSQFQQEEEELLERLCCDLSVGKEPRAVLFYKEEGNKRFGRKQYTAAAVLYSKAISHGSPGTEEIAICFANRSAVLFHLGHYSECLEDIDRAQEHGYPERLKSKILQRQAECLQKLKQSGSSGIRLPSTESISLTDPTRELAEDVVCDKLQELKLDRNLQLTNASSSLTMQFSSPKGRHLVASQNIAHGELLIREEAYVSVIIPDRKPISSKATWDISITNCDLYCHHCLQRILASLPCNQCSFSRYCSPNCRDEAWKGYHYAECSLGSQLLTLGVFCHTALRAVLLAGLRHVSEVFHQALVVKTKAQDNLREAASNELYCSNYKSLFNLQAHPEHHKDEHKFLFGLTSAALCKKLCLSLLKTNREASSLNAEGTTEKEQSGMYIIGSAILLHMLQLHCNAQAVTVLQQAYEEPAASLVESNKFSRLATAIFPVLSLLNHSCEPNTSVSFQGRYAMVRACKTITRGEEVVHCYGPYKLRMGFEERQKLLRDQYFFVCQCTACTEEQRPAVKALCDFCCEKCHAGLEGEDVLRCVNVSCSHTVRRQQLALRLQNLQQAVQKAREHLQDNHPDMTVELLTSCLSEASEFLSKNHMSFGEIFDQLAQAEASRGDWATAARHLKKSIQTVKQHYEASSLEVGHELFKLAQILFNGCNVDEAMNTIVRAQHILCLHYGPDHCLVQELNEMKTCLLELPGMKGSLES
ncbi:PREDICTED: SET and MYND domain-containing protein 4 [Nanorana parkeri]|uniref:SET and MYND domain-containing protein 4 n=1 Tax=Nanorana parkeri TaxID=125878 RepID=UPI00085448BA|nr:PREDICTED: SET and MYND domain-containing protein 4 [Nanorana parkeri]